MAAVGATSDSATVGSRKERKNWRESVKYLHSRVDRARFLRREGSVMVVNLAALRQEMEMKAGQQRQKGTVVGYCSCGAAYPSHVDRGGNRNARRKRQRANRERLRDDRVVSQALVQSLSSLQGGSDSKNLETTGKLCVLHQFAVPSVAKKDIHSSPKDKPIYVGVSPHSHSLDNVTRFQKKKEGDGWNSTEEKGAKKEQKTGESNCCRMSAE